jgi:hypothetical protein
MKVRETSSSSRLLLHDSGGVKFGFTPLTLEIDAHDLYPAKDTFVTIGDVGLIRRIRVYASPVYATARVFDHLLNRRND